MKKFYLLTFMLFVALGAVKADGYPASITITFEKTGDITANAYDQENGIYIGHVTTQNDWENFWLTDGLDNWYGDDKTNSHKLTTSDKQNCWADGKIGDYTVYIDLKNLNWYCLEDKTVTIGSEQWITYCDENDFIIPEGLSGYTISIEDGILNLNLTYKTGDIVPHYTGVLLNGNAGNYTLRFTGQDLTAPAFSHIYGTATANTVNSWEGSDGKNVLLYKLADDGTNGLGWYWDSANGQSLNCGANRCYLWLTQTEAGYVSGSARSFIRMFNDVTGVKEVIGKKEDVREAYYDLSGRRVEKPTKGLYIVNGKKIFK